MVLFIVAAGLRETGGTAWIAQRLLGMPKSVTVAQLRLMVPTAALSGFVNNTPLVVMMMPYVNDWAKKLRMSPSRLMMPMSFAAILGGMCTLIGTSTNLIVDGWTRAHPDAAGFNMFDLAWVGVPAAVLGIAYIVVGSRWLLPDRKPVINPQDDARSYTVEMMVDTGSPLAGRTVEDAGLRHLPGLFLIEIDRNGQVLPAVSSSVVLAEGDRLVFAGVVESVVDLQKIRGLSPATDQVFKLNEPRTNRVLVEAVVSNTCPIVGRTIREGRFRTQYNAAVIAVARNGEQVRGKLGDIRLRVGDTLLLEARSSFSQQQRDSRDFFLVSNVENSTPLRHERAPVALVIFTAMVALAATGVLDMLPAAMLAAVGMILTRCVRASVARGAVDWQIIMVILGALALGKAIEESGAALAIAQQMIDTIGRANPLMLLAAIYITTLVFTEVITNNAAAVLVLPIAYRISEELGLSFEPFAVAIMIAASASFITPIGYQTNMIVYGPGGYRFTDYTKFGLPLAVLVFVIAMIVIPMCWPLAIG